MNGKENRNPAPWAFSLAIIGILLLIIYVASYRALVEQGGEYRTGDENKVTFRRYRLPRYQLGGFAATYFFWPAHQLDRQLRPQEWMIGPY